MSAVTEMAAEITKVGIITGVEIEIVTEGVITGEVIAGVEGITEGKEIQQKKE